MTRDIKFCLVYRDMWQSSGKYMPRKDQLVKVAEPIVAMGCFSRVETNGGGFEQINLLMGENPNENVRAWTAPLRKAGIQTQMLERGLNGIRMSPCPTDVRRLMFKVKKQQGTDIARSFDGLNNPQNLEHSFAYAREAGMIAQAALCITHSPIHTVDYYVQLADAYIELGAEEICIKDMAGIGRPASIGKMIKGIKARHPDMLIQYHGHSTPGFSVASSLEAARAGADIIDVGMEPLSWGTGHADLLTIHAMLEDAGFRVPEINIDAYMHARKLTQEFIDDFLGYYINPRNRFMNSILISPGLPGGMMGSLMADLEQNLQSLNSWLDKRGKDTISQDRLLLMLFKEVEYVWPQLGYPPLVTPFSQYVKNVALMNVLQMIKGRGRWTMIDENTWGMILGRSGQLPGKLGVDIVELAREQGREFYKGIPQDLYADELELFAMKMDEHGWAYGPDDEELFEYAMHPTQYEEFKSGKSREQFMADLKERIAQRDQPLTVREPREAEKPRSFVVEVDGEKFSVKVAYDDDPDPDEQAQASANGVPGAMIPITAPLEGKFFLTRETGERGIEIGVEVHPGDTFAY
ncbi:MAG: oxaloacetate decarboxylase, partial [Saprospiraceae bacterium]|nr:oxaloacetate decarboxylase [Saprospiraceae bacterium]